MTKQADHLLLRDFVFRLQGSGDSRGGDSFQLMKPQRMLEQYEAMWARRVDFRPKHILELGIFDGGSVALWCERFNPERFVGIDFANREDSAYFNKWKAAFDGTVKTYWRTSQTDTEKLGAIIRDDLLGTVDLVIDDASHLYTETKASFEYLFPRLRPGGVYIIEDWSWGLWPNLPVGFRPHGTELPKLVAEISEAVGSISRAMSGGKFRPVIAGMEIFADFVVIERGPASVESLNLDSYITRRP